MKKKILLALNTLDCGGIEKSALSLLQGLNPVEYAITLTLSQKKGEFLPYVPSYVNIVVLDYPKEVILERQLGKRRLLRYYLTHLNFFQLGILLIRFVCEKFMTSNRRNLCHVKRVLAKVKKPTESYDLALAYANLEQLYYVSNFVPAKRKAVWFHIENPTGGVAGFRDLLPLFKRMDALFCVSRKLEDSVRRILPEMNGRIFFYPHIFNTKMMYDWAEECVCSWPGDGVRVRILSVGRVRPQKGFDIVPEIAARLKKDGFKISWCIIGDGALYSFVESRIENYDVRESVFLLGTKVNPYPYFKMCDIYVQPSRDEGYCLTVAEARAFHKPILATDFFGAREQLEDGRCGLIVKFGVNDIYNGLKRLLIQKDMRDEYVQKLMMQKIDNVEGVKMVESLLINGYVKEDQSDKLDVCS